MNLCFNRSESSDYDPNQSYKKPAHLMKDYSPFESAYKIDPQKGSVKDFIQNEMRKFDITYNLHTKKSSEQMAMKETPSLTTIFTKISKWAIKAKLESEIPIISLIYIEVCFKCLYRPSSLFKHFFSCIF